MMINKEKELKLSAIINTDETLSSELATAETVTEICEIFARRGLELTEEEVTALMCQVAVPAEGELAEDDLDDVAGGITWEQAYGAFMFGARVGIGIRMVYDKYKYGNAQKTYTYSQLKSGKFW